MVLKMLKEKINKYIDILSYIKFHPLNIFAFFIFYPPPKHIYVILLYYNDYKYVIN